MKRLILIPFIAMSLYATECENLLKEGDKYLQRIPLCDVVAVDNATLAKAYYERYNICVKDKKYNVKRPLKIHPFDDEFKCEGKNVQK